VIVPITILEQRVIPVYTYVVQPLATINISEATL